MYIATMYNSIIYVQQIIYKLLLRVHFQGLYNEIFVFKILYKKKKKENLVSFYFST